MSESEKEERDSPIYIVRGQDTWVRDSTPRGALIEYLKRVTDPCESFDIIKLPDGVVDFSIDEMGTIQWEGSTLKAQDVPLDKALIDDLEFELYDRLFLAVKIVKLVEHLQGSSSKYSKDLLVLAEKMEENL